MKKRRKFRRFSFGGANENIHKNFYSDFNFNLYVFSGGQRFCRKHGRPQH